jgi:hypothetical protein
VVQGSRCEVRLGEGRGLGNGTFGADDCFALFIDLINLFALRLVLVGKVVHFNVY